MFKLIKDKVQKSLAKRALMTMKVDIVFSDGVLTYKYKKLLVLQEEGTSYLCYYDYTTNSEQIDWGTVLIGHGTVIDLEVIYRNVLTGERKCPDEGQSPKYLNEIIIIDEETIEKGRMEILSGNIKDMLDKYDCKRKNLSAFRR